MRFLIDECLSLDLVSVAAEVGHEAHHVAHVGKASWKDWNVARFAHERELIIVTNNASDFRKLYAAEPLHAGLVILVPSVGRELQKQLFSGALDFLAGSGEPINQALEVGIKGEDVVFSLYDLPSEQK